MEGTFILVVGPSGSGKSTLLSYLKTNDSSIVFPRSCTTRTPRPGEVEGEKYFFVTPTEFDMRKERGDLLEWATYAGNQYGVLKSEVLEPLQEGKTVVREVEVQGARQILAAMPNAHVAVVYIDAGSWEELEKRITARAPIPQVELAARRKRYEDEVTFKQNADAIILNPDGGLEQAKESFIEVIKKLSE